MAPAVVMVSLALGALLMGMLAGCDTTASAAYATPRSGDYGFENASFRVGKFTGIKVSSAIEVIITQGKDTGEVEVVSSMLPYLRVDNQDGILNIRYEDVTGNIQYGNTVVKVTMSDLKSIVAGTAAGVKTEGAFNLRDNITVDASSAAEVSFGELTGKEMTVTAQSAAQVYALVLDMENLSVNASSASNVRLHGLNVDKISADAGSASVITLSGRCNMIQTEVGGMGEIKTQGLIRETMPLSRDKGNQPRLRRP